MGKFVAAAALTTALLLPNAHGQTSCLPAYTALQSYEILNGPTQFNYSLYSQNSQGTFKTHVLLSGVSDGLNLLLKIQFDPTFEGVSLAYNLYAVMVIADGEPLAYYDFTRACQSAGLSFFPGRAVQIPPIKLLGSTKQKLQIMVWGKH